MRQFKTKTGYCHISNDKILLTRDKESGDISTLKTKNTIRKLRLSYLIFSFVFLFIAHTFITQNQYVVAGAFIAIALIYFWGVISTVKFSNTQVIERKSIQKVVYNRGIRFITRARFIVYFEEKPKKIRKRYIMLPGSLSDGAHETERALKVMREEGLIE